jgi:Ca-activated chloride channel family protein
LPSIGFGSPLYLWLLVLPAALLVVWVGRVIQHVADIRRQMRARPGRVRLRLLGELAFWFCLLTCISLCVVALAHPRMVLSVVSAASADFVMLQDGSASMYVRDVAPDRWQRSVGFMRTFADALSWKGDRMALALFAHSAAPQVRLTRDPNALFFFLDHLGTHSPFRLDDNLTWDTNIEEAVHWGVSLVERDAQLFGDTGNPKALVLISDGQAWSGSVANALALARTRGFVVHVIGVGTPGGGLIPASVQPSGEIAAASSAPIRAVLDRNSLRAIAGAGGGEYFELGRESDRAIAARIIASVRTRAGSGQERPRLQEVYWQFLVAAAAVLCLGTACLTARTELWWQAIVAGATALVIARVLS